MIVQLVYCFYKVVLVICVSSYCLNLFYWKIPHPLTDVYVFRAKIFFNSIRQSWTEQYLIHARNFIHSEIL